MQYEGRPSNELFPLFLKLYGGPEQNSSHFSNIQPCIVNENVFNFEGFLVQYEGRPSNELFPLFLKLYGGPEQNSNYFSNSQPCTITCLNNIY